MDGTISLVANLDEGMQAEVGVVDGEGMPGLPLLAGVQTSFIEAMAQSPGAALRMEAGAFRRELGGNPGLASLPRRYGEAFQARVMQTAACNGRHGLEQRLARWLLMAHDRIGGDELPLTQDFIVTMLAVHRPSITETASILQRAGLIRYRSGIITVLDRAGPEAAALRVPPHRRAAVRRHPRRAGCLHHHPIRAVTVRIEIFSSRALQLSCRAVIGIETITGRVIPTAPSIDLSG